MRTRVGKLIGVGLGLAVAASLVASIPAAARSGSAAAITKSAVPAVTSTAQLAAATETINLCADDTASVTMPDSVVVPFWGFSPKNGGCAAPELPGPPVEVSAGNDIVINLTNNLSQNLSLVFPGQINVTASMVSGPGAIGDFGLEAQPGEVIRYEFTADQPGTYLYESSRNRQVMMGLYGALIVRPETGAYGVGTESDEEATLVLSEIDPAFNGNPSGFNLLNFAPKYWLINGEAYDDTDSIDAAPGSRLLLRYLNAGSFHHTMTMLGADQCLIAKDAYPIGIPYDVVAETIPAGSTLDAIVTLPGSFASIPLYNRQLHLNNAASFPGGMLTFIESDGEPVSGTAACQRGAPVNQAPFVNLGPDRTVTQATASLDGIVTDDGLPSGALNTTWTKQSGPGTVSFGNASLVATTATFSAAGAYVLRLTASDGALSAFGEVTVTVDLNMHIGDLDASPAARFIGGGGNPRWRAFVTIAVHDANHGPVAGATVTGTWSAGDTNGRQLSCTTGTNGRCTLQSGRIPNGTASVVFDVTNITKAAFSYLSSANHDPESDSNGTSITVNKP